MFGIETFIFLAVAMAIGIAINYGVQRWEQSRRIGLEDLNEDIEPAFDDGLLDIQRLKRDPSFLLQLQGKVSSITFLQDADTQASDYDEVESFVIDVNGAIHTLETTFGRGYQGLISPRKQWSRGHGRQRGVVEDLMDEKAIDRRNVEIEENARWLAEKLDVPFESR